MIFDHSLSGYTAGEMLEEAATRMGWSNAEMTELLKSDLEVDHLLQFVTAVISKRMN